MTDEELTPSQGERFAAIVQQALSPVSRPLKKESGKLAKNRSN